MKFDDEPVKLEELEYELRSLLNGEFSALTLSYNEFSSSNYLTVTEYLDKHPGAEEDFISREEADLARKKNSMWTLTWWSKTPVDSYQISASSLPALVADLRKNYLE